MVIDGILEEKEETLRAGDFMFEYVSHKKKKQKKVM